MFIDRSRERGTRFLKWRVRLFGAGAALAVAGMAMERQWIIWLAIAVLVVGFLLRFAPERDPGEAEEGDAVEPEPDRDPEPARGAREGREPREAREGGEWERGG